MRVPKLCIYLVATALFFSVNTIAADKLKQQSDKVIKTLDKVELALDDANAPTANTRLTRAKRYFSNLKKLYPNESITQNLATRIEQYEQQLSFMEKYGKDFKTLKTIKALMHKNEGNSHSIYLKTAKLYDKLSADFLATDQGKAFNKEYIPIREKGEAVENELTAEIEQKDATREHLRKLRQEAEVDIGHYYELWQMVYTPEDLISLATTKLQDLDKVFDTQAQQFAQEAASLKEKYQPLVKAYPEKKYIYGKVSMQQFLAMADPGALEKSRANTTKIFADFLIDKTLKDLTDGLMRLTEWDQMHYSQFADAIYQQQDKSFGLKAKLMPYLQKAKLDFPQDKQALLTTKYTQLKQALEKSAEKELRNENDDHFEYETDKIEELMQQLQKNWEMDSLVEFGAMPERDWKIYKNGLGIPMYKEGEGAVVFQRDGEPFKRMYWIHFRAQFDGSSYREVGNYEPATFFIPTK